MLKRVKKIDRTGLAVLLAGVVAIIGPFGLAVGFHSHPIGHHSHPVPVAQIYLAKYADDSQVPVGGTTGYNVDVNNYGAAGTVEEVVDTLPLGFRYLAGSTSGAILADPVVDGRKLHWRLDRRVGAYGHFTFHFEVRVADRPGLYRNVVDAVVAAPGTEQGSGPTAPVYVGVPTELKATAALVKNGALRLKFSARLTSNGRPLAGQFVDFTTTTSTLGCSARTNSDGVAECTGAPVLAGAIVSLGYDAAFEPWTGIYGPSWDHGDLVEKSS